jgi:hypothetical protein
MDGAAPAARQLPGRGQAYRRDGGRGISSSAHLINGSRKFPTARKRAEKVLARSL